MGRATNAAVFLSFSSLLLLLTSIPFLFYQLEDIEEIFKKEYSEATIYADSSWQELRVMEDDGVRRVRRKAKRRDIYEEKTEGYYQQEKKGYYERQRTYGGDEEPTPIPPQENNLPLYGYGYTKVKCCCSQPGYKKTGLPMSYKCPYGHRGPRGPKGESGIPGTPGRPGYDGEDASPTLYNLGPREPVTPPRLDPYGPQPPSYSIKGPVCEPCPPGPAGETGSKGPPGHGGRKGPAGTPGIPGIPGKCGDIGPQGEGGSRGKVGKPGVKGTKGTDGIAGGKGLPGSKGADGSVGGPRGIGGSAGEFGQPGEPGSVGIVGPPGPPGADGLDGVPGREGNVGSSGLYCACPPKNTPVSAYQSPGYGTTINENPLYPTPTYPTSYQRTTVGSYGQSDNYGESNTQSYGRKETTDGYQKKIYLDNPYGTADTSSNFDLAYPNRQEFSAVRKPKTKALTNRALEFRRRLNIYGADKGFHATKRRFSKLP